MYQRRSKLEQKFRKKFGGGLVGEEVDCSLKKSRAMRWIVVAIRSRAICKLSEPLRECWFLNDQLTLRPTARWLRVGVATFEKKNNNKKGKRNVFINGSAWRECNLSINTAVPPNLTKPRWRSLMAGVSPSLPAAPQRVATSRGSGGTSDFMSVE